MANGEIEKLWTIIYVAILLSPEKELNCFSFNKENFYCTEFYGLS